MPRKGKTKSVGKAERKTATQAQATVRVGELYQLRLAGAELADIKAHAAENGWGIQERQLFHYIRQADDLIAEKLAPDMEEAKNRHLRQRRMLFARCMKAQDYKAALAVLQDEAKLIDLYPAKKPEPIPGQGSGLTMNFNGNITFEQRRTQILALAAELGIGSEALAAHDAADDPGRSLAAEAEASD